MTQYDQNDFNRRKFSLDQLGGGLGAGIFGLGGIKNFTGGPRQLPQFPSQGPPRGWPYQGGTQMAIHGFGEELGEFGETLGGYGETLGGYGEQLGGFEEKLGGFGEQLSGLGDRFGSQLSGLGDRFGGVDAKLSKIEEGIGSLLQNRGSGRGMNMPNYGYSPYNMLLNSFFGGYR